jgi:hypothetical protein
MDADDYKVYKIKLRKFYRGLVDKFAAANGEKFAGYEQKETPKSKPSQQSVSQEEDGLPF